MVEWLDEQNNKRKELEQIYEQQKFDGLKYKFIDLIKDKQWNDTSELLVDYILSKEKIYTTKDDVKSEMWIYRGGIYIPQGKSEVKEIMRKILGKWYSQWHYNQVIAKIEADTFIEHNTFFNTNYKYELPVANGILNIKTGELTEFSPKKIFFSKCPVKYDVLAQCPMIDTFLSEVLANPEDKNVFYELGGFALLKEYTFEKAFMFVGGGRNGKGKSLELIKRVIGAENCFSLSLSALQHDNADVSQLFGKMINLAGDIGHKDLQETSMFKSLTGRDLITTRRKFLQALTFENYAKFVFACNELPMVYDISKGFWDRWILLEFPYYFGTKEEIESAKDEKGLMKLRDENIIDKITTETELSGLLNQFLFGLNRLFENRKFSSTMGSEETKNTWIRKSNSFMAFCMDKLDNDYDGRINKKELRKKYVEYCKNHKIAGKSDNVIKRTLEEMFGASDGSTDVLGSYERYWSGIKWK
jgi:putative DNA primase/helicase